jgi:hypothetical protein
VQPNDAVEERPGHRRRSVGVAKRDEVGVLGEAINHRQDHRLARHLERLQEAGRLACLGLVALARGACMNQGLYQGPVAGM